VTELAYFQGLVNILQHLVHLEWRAPTRVETLKPQSYKAASFDLLLDMILIKVIDFITFSKVALFDLLLDLALIKVINYIAFSKAASYDLLLDLVESPVIQPLLRYVGLYLLKSIVSLFITYTVVLTLDLFIG
jgi:hypothetical protein